MAVYAGGDQSTNVITHCETPNSDQLELNLWVLRLFENEIDLEEHGRERKHR